MENYHVVETVIICILIQEARVQARTIYRIYDIPGYNPTRGNF